MADKTEGRAKAPYYVRERHEAGGVVHEVEVGFPTLAELQAHMISDTDSGDTRERARERVACMNAALAELGAADAGLRGHFFQG